MKVKYLLNVFLVNFIRVFCVLLMFENSFLNVFDVFENLFKKDWFNVFMKFFKFCLFIGVDVSSVNDFFDVSIASLSFFFFDIKKLFMSLFCDIFNVDNSFK